MSAKQLKPVLMFLVALNLLLGLLFIVAWQWLVPPLTTEAEQLILKPLNTNPTTAMLALTQLPEAEVAESKIVELMQSCLDRQDQHWTENSVASWATDSLLVGRYLQIIADTDSEVVDEWAPNHWRVAVRIHYLYLASLCWPGSDLEHDLLPDLINNLVAWLSRAQEVQDIFVLIHLLELSLDSYESLMSQGWRPRQTKLEPLSHQSQEFIDLHLALIYQEIWHHEFRDWLHPDAPDSTKITAWILDLLGPIAFNKAQIINELERHYGVALRNFESLPDVAADGQSWLHRSLELSPRVGFAVAHEVNYMSDYSYKVIQDLDQSLLRLQRRLQALSP